MREIKGYISEIVKYGKPYTYVVVKEATNSNEYYCSVATDKVSLEVGVIKRIILDFKVIETKKGIGVNKCNKIIIRRESLIKEKEL